MNPLLNQMNNPFNLALGMLQQRNPQGYQQYLQLRNSGSNPNEILDNLMGGLNEQQRNMVKALGNQFNQK